MLQQIMMMMMTILMMMMMMMMMTDPFTNSLLVKGALVKGAHLMMMIRKRILHQKEFEAQSFLNHKVFISLCGLIWHLAAP